MMIFANGWARVDQHYQQWMIGARSHSRVQTCSQTDTGIRVQSNMCIYIFICVLISEQTWLLLRDLSVACQLQHQSPSVDPLLSCRWPIRAQYCVMWLCIDQSETSILPALAPPPKVDGCPVGDVEEQEHDGEHAEEYQICSWKSVRLIST